jgi:hypothetical protein
MAFTLLPFYSLSPLYTATSLHSHLQAFTQLQCYTLMQALWWPSLKCYCMCNCACYRSSSCMHNPYACNEAQYVMCVRAICAIMICITYMTWILLCMRQFGLVWSSVRSSLTFLVIKYRNECWCFSIRPLKSPRPIQLELPTLEQHLW